jgi:ubiquinone/menaquinone biosynthesis C-methylase UbiE
MDYVDARNYDRGMWLLERLRLENLRRRLLADARGDILEIGAGTGVNFPLCRSNRAVTAIDLRPAHLAAAANKARATSRLPVTVACADVHELPFADNAFDTVVGTLVFCSIGDPPGALAEIRRVLRPGGQLLLMEHVRGATPVARRLTDWLHPLWLALQGECHLNREAAQTVAAAGFRISHTSRHALSVLQIIRAEPIA